MNRTRTQFQIELVGTSPLLMHNNLLVDPLHPLKRKIKKLTDKRTAKTEADIEMIYRLEWEGALYFNSEAGPYIPSRCLSRMLIDGARKSRHGKQFEQGLIINGDSPLQYDGPRDMKGLWEAGFYWTTVAGNQRASIMRTRPRFDQWSLKFDAIVEPDLVDREMLDSALYHSCLIGLCDGRAVGFGRFDYEIACTADEASQPSEVEAVLA